MTDHSQHCPFLNKADHRCARNLCIDALGHAFDYCFGYYEGCGVYLDLLADRQTRRALSRNEPAVVFSEDAGDELPRHRKVEVRISGRVLQNQPDAAAVSHASGL